MEANARSISVITQAERMAKRTRLLIIDDHNKVRGELVCHLRKTPDLHVVAESGESNEAVKLASELQPDVVLLDVKMADRNGLRTCRRIAQAAPEACILVLTSYPDEDEKSGVYQAGARGYVLKDIDLVGLIREIRALVE